MQNKIKNYKDLLSYCDSKDTYVLKKQNNNIYLQNGDILKFNRK